MAAGARRRLLPAWMEAAGNERAVAAPPKAGRWRRRRRRRQGQGQAAARPRAVLHCMNEAELLEVALGVLAEGEEGEEKARFGKEEEQEIQPTLNEAPGSPASRGGHNACSVTLPSPPDAGADAERTSWEDSEDDVLKYVREIFFS